MRQHGNVGVHKFSMHGQARRGSCSHTEILSQGNFKGLHHVFNSNNLRLKRSNFILEIYIQEANHLTIYLCGLLFHILLSGDNASPRYLGGGAAAKAPHIRT